MVGGYRLDRRLARLADSSLGATSLFQMAVFCCTQISWPERSSRRLIAGAAGPVRTPSASGTSGLVLIELSGPRAFGNRIATVGKSFRQF